MSAVQNHARLSVLSFHEIDADISSTLQREACQADFDPARTKLAYSRGRPRSTESVWQPSIPQQPPRRPTAAFKHVRTRGEKPQKYPLASYGSRPFSTVTCACRGSTALPPPRHWALLREHLRLTTLPEVARHFRLSDCSLKPSRMSLCKHSLAQPLLHVDSSLTKESIVGRSGPRSQASHSSHRHLEHLDSRGAVVL